MQKIGQRTWLCEWCSAEDVCKFVDEHPTECKIVYCNLCDCETWHAPSDKLQRKEAIIAKIFGLCSDYYCPRKTWCHRQSQLTNRNRPHAFVNGYECRSNHYEHYIKITDEDLGRTRFNHGSGVEIPTFRRGSGVEE